MRDHPRAAPAVRHPLNGAKLADRQSRIGGFPEQGIAVGKHSI